MNGAGSTQAGHVTKLGTFFSPIFSLRVHNKVASSITATFSTLPVFFDVYTIH
ncbi:MAG: hypothetical protein ACJZ9G_02770 [Rhodospirillales bacterium]